MAIDTAAKRYSMENFGNPIITPLIIPDGTVEASDRAHFLNLYSGIALDGGGGSPPSGSATGTRTMFSSIGKLMR